MADVEVDSIRKQEIAATLRVNNKGWNIQLFEDQHALKPYACHKCHSICRDVVELGCDHKDNDIFLYCNDCLRELIKENDNKCPIDAHHHPRHHPIIISTRAARRYISKSTVYCPHSVAYKSPNVQYGSNDGHNGQITDTLRNDEEKEGNAQCLGKASNVCLWKGILNDLINDHIILCTEQNNPSFALKIKIKNLENECIELKNKLNQQRIIYENDLKEKQSIIDRIQKENIALQNKFNANENQNEEKHNESFKVGDKVLIKGLKKEKHYNDSVGNITEINKSKGRYTVKLRKKPISIKPTNMRLFKNITKKERIHLKVPAVWIKPGSFEDESKVVDLLEPLFKTVWDPVSPIYDHFGWKMPGHFRCSVNDRYNLWCDDTFLKTQTDINMAATYLYCHRDRLFRVKGDCIITKVFDDDYNEFYDDDYNEFYGNISVKEIQDLIMESKDWYTSKH